MQKQAMEIIGTAGILGLYEADLFVVTGKFLRSWALLCEPPPPPPGSPEKEAA